jgi:hypothetical protein
MMDYFHWVGGTVLLVYGIRKVGLRIYVLLMLMWVPAVLLIVNTLSGWTATVAALAALAAVGRLMQGPLRQRERERAVCARTGSSDR